MVGEAEIDQSVDLTRARDQKDYHSPTVVMWVEAAIY